MQLAQQAERILFGHVPDAGTPEHLLLRPRVSMHDVMATISQKCLVRLHDAVFDLTEYSDADETREQRLVRTLLEPELPDGSAEEWFQPYVDVGLEELFPLIVRLRVINAVDFVVAHELHGLDRPLYEIDGYADFRQIEYDLWRELSPVDAFYNFGLDCNLSEFKAKGSSPPRTPPMATIEGLAALLARRLRTLVNGDALVQQGGQAGCLASLAVALWTVADQRIARTRHNLPRFRLDVFEACLRSLELREHEETARRVLIRNHPRHIPIDVSGLAAGWVAPAWGGRLGIFEQNGDALILAHRRT